MTIHGVPGTEGMTGNEIDVDTDASAAAPRPPAQPRFTTSDPRIRALRMQAAGGSTADSDADARSGSGSPAVGPVAQRRPVRQFPPLPPAPLPHPDHLPAGEPVDWHQMLDALECDLLRAEALLDAAASEGHWPDEEELPGGSAAWSPPAALGELPADCVERAREVLARQGRIRERLRDAAADVHRQRGFTTRVFGATVSRAAPVYLDVTA